jgi:hypothetical protein
MTMSTLEMTTRHSLTPDEVKNRLGSYAEKDADLTRHLYEFGMLMLGESERRTDKMDSRASTIIVWSIGLSGFLLTQLDQLRSVEKWLGFGAGVVALSAGISAMLALRARRWMWFSDRAWFPDPSEVSGLTSVMSRQTYLAFKIKTQQAGANHHKGVRLIVSELLLLTAGALISLTMMLRVFGV